MNKRTNGWINGFIGVLIFSGSLPATRLAVSDFDPLFLTVCRAAIAGVLAGSLLLIFRQQHPAKRDLISLLVVAFGVVIGFPLLTALALQHVTSAHAIVFIGLLPLATAVFGVLRGGERPRPVFWIFSTVGSLLVAGFALIQGGGSSPAWRRVHAGFYCRMRSWLCRRGQTFTASGELAGDLMGTRSVASSYAAIVVLFYAGLMVGDRRSRAAQSCICILIQHADWLRVLVSRSCPRGNCGGWAAPASPAFFWTAACLSDSARESGLGTRSSKYRRYHVRCSSSAICKVRQTFKHKLQKCMKV